jgi:hypothetical protein
MALQHIAAAHAASRSAGVAVRELADSTTIRAAFSLGRGCAGGRVSWPVPTVGERLASRLLSLIRKQGFELSVLLPESAGFCPMVLGVKDGNK